MSTNFLGPFEQEKFQMSIGGDFGVFYTDNKSPVFYVNTSFDIDSIGQLKPVREILDVSEVDFEELVQRDLDDFRIRRDIVNYLTDGMGYKFFPPIVVAMTQPHDSKKAIKKYYPEIKTRIIEGVTRKFEIEFKDSFCIRWFIGQDGKLVSLPTEIRWKSDHTHLMAVDGQHRLVALQAIRGLISNERLKTFYINSTKDKNKLDDLKVPVTILFFPNSVENIDHSSMEVLSDYFPNIDWNLNTRSDVKQVLRNVFVDVNKTARQPSKSRTILLDEKDLTSVFTRKVFSSIKIDMPNIYPAILEYNSLNGKETQIEKNRSIITTIGIVFNICEFLFKDPNLDNGSNLRIRLGIDKESEFYTSEEFPVEQMKANEFSLEQRDEAERLFENKWLPTFKSFYTNLLPYKKMIELVTTEFDSYKGKISSENLNVNEDEAYRVLFGGSEERFVLESNAKIVTNSSAKLSLKMLKTIEKVLKEQVENYNTFYTLMFQKGFYEALSEMIQNGFFANDHYITDQEFDKIILQLNFFLTTHPNNTFFDKNSSLYTLIIGQKASPDASKFICDLIILTLLKFGKDENKFILVNSENEKIISDLFKSKLESITDRIQNLLGKEFDLRTDSRQRKLDIKMQKESGNKVGAKTSESAYELDRDSFIEDKYIEQEKKLKSLLNID